MHKIKRGLTSWLFLIPCVVMLSFAPRYGEWLGLMFPVSSPVKVLDLVPDDERPGWARLSFTMEKRLDCEFVSLTMWWTSSDGINERIPWENVITNPEVDQSRPTGRNVATILVGTLVEPAHWNMQVRHDCHPLLPNFRTNIWP